MDGQKNERPLEETEGNALNSAGGLGGEILSWGLATPPYYYHPQSSPYPLQTGSYTSSMPDSSIQYTQYQDISLGSVGTAETPAYCSSHLEPLDNRFQCDNLALFNLHHSTSSSLIHDGAWGRNDHRPFGPSSTLQLHEDTVVLPLRPWPITHTSGLAAAVADYGVGQPHQTSISSARTTLEETGRTEYPFQTNASEESPLPSFVGSGRPVAPYTRRQPRKPRHRDSVSKPTLPPPPLPPLNVYEESSSKPPSVLSKRSIHPDTEDSYPQRQRRRESVPALKRSQSSTSSTAPSSTLSGEVPRELALSMALPSSIDTALVSPTFASDDIRARNRVAANKCRAKNKVAIAELEDRDHEVILERNELKKEVSILQEQVYLLKQELFKHSDCDCAGIRAYLSSLAQQIVQRASESSSFVDGSPGSPLSQ
ncbi:hypothetical protein QBC35DRAFT_447646 [Podospora australis]|uniref:BZIP domain-containing protein n=1 Tax=Podospora australis TaxID=1536484 RepID=A0AAN6X1H1_9PEZI|nr:hypothetical protein QBC35DRAFT_447646 [Podospora australis]